jgi:hypothetical protein
MKRKYFTVALPDNLSRVFTDDEVQDWIENTEKDMYCEFRCILNSSIVFKRLESQLEKE